MQEKYDELDNIISSINLLIDEIKDKDYISQLNEIKFQAMNEMEEVEEQLEEENNKEKWEMNYQYERRCI